MLLQNITVAVNFVQAKALGSLFSGIEEEENVIIYETYDESLEANVIIVDFELEYATIYPDGQVVMEEYEDVEKVEMEEEEV